MSYRIVIGIIVAAMVAMTSVSSVAGQGRGGAGGGSGGMDRTPQMDRDRMYDRDRTQDRVRIDTPSQDRDRGVDHDMDRDRDQDRDRVHLRDPSTMADKDIYGSELMTVQERNQYREELGKMQTRETRNAFQIQHEEKMRLRAQQQNKDLVPPGQGPIFGGEMMSVQERNEFREQLRHFESDEQRQSFMAQHREKMEQRAQAQQGEKEEAE